MILGGFVANAQTTPTDITKVLKFTNDNYNMGTIAYGKPKEFIDDFAKSLAIADELYLLDIYPARELPIEGVTSDWLVSKIDLKDKQVISKADLLQVIDTKKPKLLVTMGAGDIDLLLNDLKLSLS